MIYANAPNYIQKRITIYKYIEKLMTNLKNKICDDE